MLLQLEQYALKEHLPIEQGLQKWRWKTDYPRIVYFCIIDLWLL